MKCACLFFSNLCVFAVFSQEIMTFDSIQDSIDNQLSLFPQEKIHLHTDRNVYVPGERIWFKAYVVDAFTHTSPTFSRYAYIELINYVDSLVHRVMVTIDENGLFYGQIFLSNFVTEGDYTLRAYTRYMENIGDDYFFKKPIRINNYSNRNTSPRVELTKQYNDKSNYDVSFFPEGGNLLEGVNCRVAFKALNSDGTSESIVGEIVDRAGNRISEVRTDYAGMGSFHLIPVAGQAYYLRCKNQSEQEKRFQLPESQNSYSIAVTYRNKRAVIELKKTPDIQEQSLYLLVHCRGTVLYYAPWDLQKQYIALPCENAPSGVMQIMLFDRNMNPLSERLIFINNDDQARLVFTPDKPLYKKRENVHATIQMTGADYYLFSGNISVSVTDNTDLEVDMLHTISSSLLLSSELKGHIESPGYYLQDHEKAVNALDLLMMTHGWRRYAVAEAIKGKHLLPQKQFEVAKEISGSLQRMLFGGQVGSNKVMFITNEGDFTELETDTDGTFCLFAHYPENTKFVVQAWDQKGGSIVKLMLNHELFPNLRHAPKSRFPELVSDSMDITLNFMKKASQRVQYDDDMRFVQLPEVVVSASKNKKIEELRLFAKSINSSLITREEIDLGRPHKTSDLFNGVSGFFVGANDMLLYRNSIPVILLDGVQLPEGVNLNDIQVDDVECVEILSGPAAASFAIKNTQAVANIITKRGVIESEMRNKPNFVSYEPIGYQKPVEFYAPKYDTPELKLLTVPDCRTTIYWKPDIIVSEDGGASFDFYTSDFSTTYSVVIEGILDNGKIIRHVETIEVK